MEELITLHLYADDYDRLTSWQLAGWCQRQGADEFTLTAITVEGAEQTLFEQFDQKTEQFHLPQAVRRNLTAYDRVFEPEAFIRPTELWHLTSASFAVLQEFLPDGLFTNGSTQDGWFEDPVLYREGEFMLGVVSHESEGIVRVTEAERQLFIAEGFKVRPFGSSVGY